MSDGAEAMPQRETIMGDANGTGGGLMADQAYDRLIAMLRGGALASGQFVSMPVLVELMGFPLAATREAVKRAEGRGLVSVLPKRGVMVMSAGPAVTRDCLDLRSMLDQEGARRLIAAKMPVPLDALRAAHEAVLRAAHQRMTPELPRRAMETDLSLHDALGGGLGNPMIVEIYAVNRDRITVIQNTRHFLADRIVSAMEEHLAIIDALERRGEAEAVAAIRHHCATTLRWWGVEAEPPQSV
ncbi:GntR family transcriptional regulator [soil metagenome]